MPKIHPGNIVIIRREGLLGQVLDSDPDETIVQFLGRPQPSLVPTKDLVFVDRHGHVPVAKDVDVIELTTNYHPGDQFV